MAVALPAWLDRPAGIILAGSFLSSMSAFLVAPYLMVYLTQEAGMDMALAGGLIGLSYWLLRAGGLFATALVNRYGYRSVMLWFGGLRIPGYLLLAVPHVPSMTMGLCLVGFGGGCYFPPSKALLIRLLPEEHHLKALSVRNVTANVGVALGPLVGTLTIHLWGLHAVVLSAAACFSVLGLLITLLPDVKPFAPQAVSMRPQASDSAGMGWRTRWWGLVGMYVVPLLPISVLSGVLLTQMDTLLPLVAKQWGYFDYVGVLFTVNAVLVVVLQPVALVLVRRSLLWSAVSMASGSFLLFALLIPGVRGLPALVVSVSALTLAEVVMVMAIDDRIRRYREREVTLAYGLQGLFDGFGGIAGASLVPLLMAWAGGSTPAQTATLIGLAGAMGAAALLAVALLNAHREGSRS